ncbi:MAG: DUF4292 domain-containing protein [Aquaticitalea sp.]
MRQFKFVSLILVISVFIGCRSAKSLTATGSIKENMTAKQLIKENKKQTADFKTLQAKVKIDYNNGDKSNGVSVTLRMEKDKVIWLSAPLGAARALITPEKVRYYNKLENEYFDGDFSLLSELLGIELDYDKVQNLLLGEMIFDINDETFTASNNEISYVLQPVNQKPIFEIFYLLNPGHFKLDSQQLSQSLQKRMLQVDYKKYQLVNKEIIPEIINIDAVEDISEIKIDLEYKSVSINEDVRFPFEIPSGYKEIQIK